MVCWDQPFFSLIPLAALIRPFAVWRCNNVPQMAMAIQVIKSNGQKKKWNVNKNQVTKTINLWIRTNSSSNNINNNDVVQMKRKIHKGKKESNRLSWFHFKCLFYCVENDANVAECERLKPHLCAAALSNPVKCELCWTVVAK